MEKFALPKKNILLIIVGLCILIIGYLLMVGGGSNDPATFNYDMFDFRRIVLAPVLVILGFVVEIFAIMWKPKNK